MSHGRTRRPEGGANLYSLPTLFIAVDTEATEASFSLFVANMAQPVFRYELSLYGPRLCTGRAYRKRER